MGGVTIITPKLAAPQQKGKRPLGHRGGSRNDQGTSQGPKKSHDDITPYEVAQRYAAKKISREQMIKALTERRYAHAPNHSEQLAREWHAHLPDDPPGTFEEVGRAFDDGLISPADYDSICNAVADYHEARDASQ